MPSHRSTALARTNGSAGRLLIVAGGFLLSSCFGGPTSDFPFEHRDRGGRDQGGPGAPTSGNGSPPAPDLSSDAGASPPDSEGSNDGDGTSHPRADGGVSDAGVPDEGSDGAMPDEDAGTEPSDAATITPCDSALDPVGQRGAMPADCEDGAPQTIATLLRARAW